MASIASVSDVANLFSISQRYQVPNDLTAEINGGSVVIKLDFRSVYLRAVEQLQAIFTRLEDRYNPHEKGCFFISRSVQVWEEAIGNEDTASRLRDMKLLSQVMQDEKLCQAVTHKNNALVIASHNRLMQTLELHSSSFRLSQLLGQITASEDDRTALYFSVAFLQVWRGFLDFLPNQTESQELITSFKEAATPAKALMDKIYYHVWAQARQAGEKTEGANWGEENAFKDVKRLQKAIDTAIGEHPYSTDQALKVVTTPRVGDEVAYGSPVAGDPVNNHTPDALVI